LRDFIRFLRFQPDFTHFWFFQAIQHVMHVLTHKIVRFYESKRDFNNIDPYLAILHINYLWELYILDFSNKKTIWLVLDNCFLY
jgi:hypothetical protein